MSDDKDELVLWPEHVTKDPVTKDLYDELMSKTVQAYKKQVQSEWAELYKVPFIVTTDTPKNTVWATDMQGLKMFMADDLSSDINQHGQEGETMPVTQMEELLAEAASVSMPKAPSILMVLWENGSLAEKVAVFQKLAPTCTPSVADGTIRCINCGNELHKFHVSCAGAWTCAETGEELQSPAKSTFRLPWCEQKWWHGDATIHKNYCDCTMSCQSCGSHWENALIAGTTEACDECDEDDDPYDCEYSTHTCWFCVNGYGSGAGRAGAKAVAPPPPWVERGITKPLPFPSDTWETYWKVDHKNIDPVQGFGEFYTLGAIAQNALMGGRDHKGLDQLRFRAQVRLDELVARLDETFINYCDMVVGGELRHHYQIKGTWLPGSERPHAWAAWKELRNAAGPQALLEAAELFEQSTKGGGYMGPAWARIAKIVHGRITNKMDPFVFVDRVFALQHNGGIALNKLEWAVHNDPGWSLNMITLLLGPMQHKNPTDWRPLLAVCTAETQGLFTMYWVKVSKLESLGPPPDPHETSSYEVDGARYVWENPLPLKGEARERLEEDLAKLRQELAEIMEGVTPVRVMHTRECDLCADYRATRTRGQRAYARYAEKWDGQTAVTDLYREFFPGVTEMHERTLKSVVTVF